MASTHPARAVLEASAAGRFPPADGRVEAMRPDERGTWAIVEFTGHAFVLSDRPPGDALFDGVDAFGGGAPVEPLAVTDEYDDHSRVVYARQMRDRVRVLGDDRGLVPIGAGLVGRTELSVEVVDGSAGGGAGRSLILAGLATVPPHQFVFAQVAPGNAA